MGSTLERMTLVHLPEHVAHDVDLLAVENLAQIFLILPGARRALHGQVREQRIEVGGDGP
jgi:hypothetical protein